MEGEGKRRVDPPSYLVMLAALHKSDIVNK